MEDIFGTMDITKKANIRMIGLMEKVYLFTIMKSIIRAIIRMANEMDMVLFMIEIETYKSKVNGFKVIFKIYCIVYL